MARKNIDLKSLRKMKVVSDDNEENLLDYVKPVTLYMILEERSKNSPYFLRRSLNYIIQAKKENKSNSDGTVNFNYMGRSNKTLKVEVVKNFSCPFCSVPCGNFEGLQLHLTSSHDVFDYKFLQGEEDHDQEVDVSLQQGRPIFGGGNQWTPFTFRSKRNRPRKGDDSNIMKPLHVCFLRLDINELPSDTENEETNVNDETISTYPTTQLEIAQSSPTQPEIAQASSAQPAIAQSSPAQPAIAQSGSTQPAIAQSGSTQPAIAQSSSTQPAIAQSSETHEVPPAVSRRKKLLAERAEAKRLNRLNSRQFYHSRTMQPMTYEEVLADEDSEDVVDDDEANLNERLRLERNVNASKEEKRCMYLWNIFVRKQRVIADGHVPWACEAFVRLHKEEINTSETFRMWWLLFCIKLYAHGLVCAKTIDRCTDILLNSDEAGPSNANANNQQAMEVDSE